MFRFRLRFKGLEAIPSINDLASCKVFFFEIKRADSRGFIWAKVFTHGRHISRFFHCFKRTGSCNAKRNSRRCWFQFVSITSSAVDCTACYPHISFMKSRINFRWVSSCGKKIKFCKRNWHRLIHIHTICLALRSMHGSM